VHGHTRDGFNVERARRLHLLEAGPVLRPVEERLEHGEITTGEERNVPPCEGLPPDALADVGMERCGVEAHVDRSVDVDVDGAAGALRAPGARQLSATLRRNAVNSSWHREDEDRYCSAPCA